MGVPGIIATIRSYKDMGSLTLSGWMRGNGSAMEVEIYFDESTNTAYQVDEVAKVYRKASSKSGEVASYGEWIEVSET